MKKRIFSFLLVLVMVITMMPVLEIEAQAASKTEIQQKMIQILYNGAGGRMSCDFDGYVNTSGRHEGIDFCLSKGAAIYSLIDGTVTRVSNASNLSTLAIYDAANNKTVIYLHGKYSVATGQTISRGQKIGVESNLGASAAHTHIEVRDGKQKYASKSVGDYTLNNPNPYSYWEKVLGETPTQGYIEAYPKSYGKIAVYKSAGGEKYSNRYITGSTDCCKIYSFSDAWCYVSYPSSAESDGWFEAWVPTETFTISSKGKKWTADKDYTVYRRIDKKETFTTLSKGTYCLYPDQSNGMMQIVFKASDGFARMGWIEVNTHTHSYSSTVKKPTCTEKGYTTYTCSCGDSYKDNYTDALGHNYVGKDTKAATCENAGVKTFTCSRCSKQYTETITKLGHLDSNNNHYCDRCSKELSDKHKAVTVSGKAATCTESGLTEGSKCSVCNKVLKAQEEIKALGHKWDSGKVTTEATCEKDGVKTYTCQNNSTHTKTESIPANGHAYNAKVYTKATCTEKGYSTYQCVVIGCDSEYVDDYVEPLGHNWDSGKEKTAATCEEDGVKIFTCRNNSSHTKTETIAKLGHKWNSGEVTTKATCEKSGVKTYTCQNNPSHTKTEPIPALGHDDANYDYLCDTCGELLCTEHTAVTVDGKDATCTELGQTDGSKCSKCGHILKAQEPIEALDHAWDDGKVTKEATCTQDGLMVYTCKNDPSHTKEEPIGGGVHQETVIEGTPATCTEDGLTDGAKCSVCGTNIKQQELIPALGHDAELKNAKEPTCIADGYSGDEVCKTCNKTVKSGDVIKAKGHTMDDGKVIKEPAEDAEGVKLYTCTVCGETEEKVIPPIDHEHAFEQTLVKPTCMDAGYTEYVCDCGESYREDYVNATGHSFKNGKCSVCGAVDPTPIENPFVDVTKSDYFYAPVLWAVQEGVTGGTGPNTFSPNNPCTRGQVMTFLWAASGRPEPKSSINPFSDVGPADYYCKAVLWAVENGITGGIGNGQFGPNQPCTRAQVATFLWKSQGGVTVPGTSSFADVASDAYYYKAVLWAVENGITGGVGNNRFGPDQTCTRGQIATFLYKALTDN